MREVRARNAVTDGVDIFVSSLKSVVDLDSFLAELYACIFKAHAFDIRGPSSSHQDLVDAKLLAITQAHQNQPFVICFKTLRRDVFTNFYSVLQHLSLQKCG